MPYEFDSDSDDYDEYVEDSASYQLIDVCELPDHLDEVKDIILKDLRRTGMQVAQKLYEHCINSTMLDGIVLHGNFMMAIMDLAQENKIKFNGDTDVLAIICGDHYLN